MHKKEGENAPEFFPRCKEEEKERGGMSTCRKSSLPLPLHVHIQQRMGASGSKESPPPLLPSLPFETSNFRHRSSSSSSVQVLFDGCRRPFFALCLSKFNGFVLSISGPAAHLCLVVPLYPLPLSHFKTLFREKVGQSRRCSVGEDETTGEGMGEKE